MNNKVNYTFVGFMVIFGVVLLSSFTYWMLKTTDEQEVKSYIIYFDESVSGLNLEAPVKYRGIRVGKVIKMRINPKNSEQVEVKISILKSTPIKEDTVAKLTPQGITGLTYINLSLGKNGSPNLIVQEGESYPVIKTVPSFFSDVKESWWDVSSRVSKTLVRADKLLNEKNQKKISEILNNTASITHKLDTLLDQKTIISLQHSAEHLQSTTKKLDALMPDINHLIEKSIAWEQGVNASLNSIMKSYLGIHATMDEFKTTLHETTPTLNTTMQDFQEMLLKIEETLEQYQRSPSDIIYKQQELQKAPGE